jgi:hypothetical protein
MTHTVELPEHIYELARKAAETRGMTPEEWIAATLSQATEKVAPGGDEPAAERQVSEVLRGLVGSFDSSKGVYEDRSINPMAEILADKLERQGIDVPWRQRR